MSVCYRDKHGHTGTDAFDSVNAGQQAAPYSAAEEALEDQLVSSVK
ncbi:hypothetical protein FOXB_04563 [Fusarium oxysporum f. sp. conglutinans Fo5176]|uniref:Uncharacterized protein n=1 Tax=Fusarium oxysporum (strain Fo5176) TaxID=660025 RepID=F9FDT5_FUSOF|nr:hypothetical protein FOXB_04563 [Fusarium oxysporum f. sp. conglutinans Fo5176]